jgi:hypothetical protein
VEASAFFITSIVEALLADVKFSNTKTCFASRHNARLVHGLVPMPTGCWRDLPVRPYTHGVSDMLYDVFVVGAKDPSPVAQMHLAAALAKHFQAPVAEVSQAITSRNLRAGKSLDEAQARALSQQLAGLGAETELRPNMGGGRNRAPTQAPNNRDAPNSEVTLPTLPTLTAMSGGDTVGRDPFAAHTAVPMSPPTMVAGSGYGPPTMPGGPMSLGGHTTGVSSAQSGAVPRLMSAAGQSPATRATSGGRDAFGAPEDGLPRLELSRPPAPGSRAAAEAADALPKSRTSLPGSSGMDNMRMASSGESGVSGVELSGDQGKSFMQRCAKHGLYYDQRTSSSCRKCMEPAKQMARKIERNALGFKLMALRDSPSKRATWGLGLALALGFIPAAWHALAVGRPDVQSLRSEQAVLSQKVGTEEIIRQYHDLDVRVHDTHSKQRRNTGLIWVVVAGGALAGWYRLT